MPLRLLGSSLDTPFGLFLIISFSGWMAFELYFALFVYVAYFVYISQIVESMATRMQLSNKVVFSTSSFVQTQS